jgi:type II secretion system protein N
MVQKTDFQNLNDVDYSIRINKVVLGASLTLCFVIAFFINFPIQKQVEDLVKTQMSQIPGCQMSFDRLKMELFLPKIVLTDVKIPSSCIGSTQSLKMPNVSLYFRGPSFSPLGVAFKAATVIKNQPLEIYYAAGATSQVIRIEEEAFDLALLSSIIPQAPKFQGKFNIFSKISLQGPRLADLKLSIESTDFFISSQSIGGLTIPRLNIGNLSVKADSEDGKKVNIQEFIIGTTESPIRGKFSGNITLATGAIGFSPVSIKGEANVSEDFMTAFPILNLMLPQFAQKDGFYQINLGGTLSNMRPVAGP